MARVVGLDIGTSSVRAVVLETVMRGFSLVEAVEERIERPSPPEPPPAGTGEDAAPDAGPGPAAAAAEAPTEDADGSALGAPTRDALRRLASRGLFEADAVFTALRPDDVLLTKVSLPFANEREIEAVLIPQLEGRVPAEVDELVFDFERGGRLENGDYIVYAAGVDPAKLAIVLAELADVGVDPKVLDVPPFPALTVARTLVPGGHEGPVAVVDIGADTTGVAIFQGTDLQYARTFPGGGEHVTTALAEVFALDLDTAREGKHREGFIDLSAPETETATGQDAVDIANACRNGSKPLVRQLRRTLHAHATEWGKGVEAIYLCGGGAALPGLAEYVGESLGVATQRLPMAAPELATLPGFADVGLSFSTALGLALRGTTLPTRSTMNLRVGEFAFRGSYEYLRMRLPQMLVGVAVLALLSLTFALGRISLLKAEAAALDAALESATEAVFGEATTDPADVSRRLRMGSVRPSFVPVTSAYTLFADVSQSVGGTLDLGYELRATDVEVDLERRIFRVEGEADSAESVDTFEAELAAKACFRGIERNDLSQRRGTEGFTFSLQGEVRCSGSDTEEEQ